jgi:hypothetical protein
MIKYNIYYEWLLTKPAGDKKLLTKRTATTTQEV